LQCRFELRDDVMALDAVNIKPLGPALQNALVDILLGHGVRKGKAEGQLLEILVAVMSVDKLLQTVGDVAPQLFGLAVLELLGHAELGLDVVKLAKLVEELDLADAQVGAAHVDGEEGAGFVPVWDGHAPSGHHRLVR
jgi:hypothetical protein